MDLYPVQALIHQEPLSDHRQNDGGHTPPADLDRQEH
jgi:hypothetical protein